jgi:hypothetical protein
VFRITDPQNLFPEVRLGDPVRGSIRYNVNNVPALDHPELGTFYLHAPSFTVAEMVIENPRTGTDIEFTPVQEFLLTSVFVFNDTPATGELSDALYLTQGVQPPAGIEMATSVDVSLEAPPDRLQGTGLPSQLDLDDWPVALIGFGEWLGARTIEAQINKLTPVNLPIVPGDYDGDADVDAQDYTVWSISHSAFEFSTEFVEFGLDADGSGNGVIDAADYVVWRDNLPMAVADPAANVPEPSTLILAALLIAPLPRRNRRHRTSIVAGWMLARVA